MNSDLYVVLAEPSPKSILYQDITWTKFKMMISLMTVDEIRQVLTAQVLFCFLLCATFSKCN